MGRPLFSAASQPAVRIVPEPQRPAYQTWTYWKPFDPDSDEFFENDDAVYEAFIDPADRIQLPSDHPADRAPLPDSDASSSSSSEPTMFSEPNSPMDTASDADVPAAHQRATTLNMGAVRILPDPAARNPLLDAQIEAGRGLSAEERARYYLSLLDDLNASRGRDRDYSITRRRVRERVPTYLSLPEEDESRSPSPEPSSRGDTAPPAPVVDLVRPSTPPTAMFARPTTPPAAQMTPLFATPSPPPSVTPRLYSWSSLAPVVPTSPLTNRGARRSVARIVAPPLAPRVA